MIQNSYNAGNNNFYLKPPLVEDLSFLGAYLQGSTEREIILQIDGNVGYKCGYLAKNSTFMINGNVGNGCGGYTKSSTFRINGEVEVLCGESAKNSTFKTTKPETLKKLLEYVPTGNKIILIKSNGNEEVVR